MNAITLTNLLATLEHSGDLYHEFLRVPSMSAGVYQLTAGTTTPQEPHMEDKLYSIVQGKALLKVGNEDIPVEPGSLVFVAAHIEHRFHTITEDLTVLVFFAPAECSLDTREKEASISAPQIRRARSGTWQDPMIAAEASKTMSGLELIKAIRAGELLTPPIAELIGMWVAQASEGRVVIAIEPAEYHYSPLGIVHGGIAATLLDTAMGLADAQDYLRRLGASEILSREETSAESARPLESERWAGSIDTVGGATLAYLMRTTKKGGAIAAIGVSGGAAFRATVYPLILRGIKVLGIDMPSTPLEMGRELWEELIGETALLSLVDAIVSEVTLEDIPRVIWAMLGGQTRGRILVRPSAQRV